MQESIVFLVRVQCHRKESSRSLSHLLVSFCHLEASKTLAHAFVSSRLDYCISLLYGVDDGLLMKEAADSSQCSSACCDRSQEVLSYLTGAA